MSTAEEFLQNKLTERISSGTYRTLRPDNNFLDFCSNDYLGFARSVQLKQLIDKELSMLPDSLIGATGSRLLSGNSDYAELLEHQVAAFHECEAGLIFNSGYDANLGFFSAVPQKGDTIIHDELIHASIIDGARLSYANRYTFKHNDLMSLEGKLKQAKGNCYVIIESVYSMDGDTPPILSILKLTEKYDANLIVDEAHAVGLYPNGLVCQLGLQKRVFARIITFGKALGCHGAIVLGSNLLRNYLINFARSFIYTTAAPFHQLAAIKMAYAHLAQSQAEINRLKQNITLFKNSIAQTGFFKLLPSNSAIQCVLLNSNQRAKQAAAQLQEAGLDVRAILSPTVARGAERIRICLHSFNTEDQIHLLTGIINSITYDN